MATGDGPLGALDVSGVAVPGELPGVPLGVVTVGFVAAGTGVAACGAAFFDSAEVTAGEPVPPGGTAAAFPDVGFGATFSGALPPHPIIEVLPTNTEIVMTNLPKRCIRDLSSIKRGDAENWTEFGHVPYYHIWPERCPVDRWAS